MRIEKMCSAYRCFEDDMHEPPQFRSFFAIDFWQNITLDLEHRVSAQNCQPVFFAMVFENRPEVMVHAKVFPENRRLTCMSVGFRNRSTSCRATISGDCRSITRATLLGKNPSVPMQLAHYRS